MLKLMFLLLAKETLLKQDQKKFGKLRMMN